MKQQVRWQLFVRAKSAEKVQRVLERLVQIIGQESSVVECERYWKDKSLFRVIVASSLAAEPMPEAVVETLEACSRLAHRWNVGSPQTYEGNYWEFSGSADAGTIVIPGVTFVDFQVGNLPTPQPGIDARHEPVKT